MDKGNLCGLAVIIVAAGTAIACVRPTMPPLGDTESAPCGGCATWYTVCPGNYTCPDNFETGYWSCKVTVVTVSCMDFQGGVPGPGGCCTGGSLWRVSNTTTTISLMVGSGDCTFWIFPL